MDLPPPISSFLPFVLLLLAIAVFPLLPRVSHWWEHNSRKLLVSLLLAAATLAFYAFLHAGVREAGDPATLHTGFAAVVHVAEEQQGDVEVVRRHPVHVRPGTRQRLLKCHRVLADVVTDRHPDERPGAAHQNSPHPNPLPQGGRG